MYIKHDIYMLIKKYFMKKLKYLYWRQEFYMLSAKIYIERQNIYVETKICV